jgi:DNA-binding beta-propeller fold protein YncE
MAAPYILEYDADGRLISSWGGPSGGFQWPQVTGGLAVDARGNVWIAAAGIEPNPAGGRGRGALAAAAAAAGARGDAGRGAAAAPPAADAHVLKFTRDGRHVLTIGTPGKMDGPDSQTTLNRPSAIAVDSTANEVFVADMGNRRIVVFDADKGAYKRHWFAYGEKAAGPAPGPYNPADPPAKSFRDVTCIEIARDGMVYVCDKSSNRIQVFDKSGKFIKEAFVAKNTLGGVLQGSFGEVGSIGSGGRYPGQFLVVNSVAADAQGNVYTGETHHGKRVQKFVPGK